MSTLSIVRIIAFFFTVAVAACCPKRIDFIEIVSIGALAHYVVAMLYSRKQLAAVSSTPGTAALAAGLGVSSLVIFFAKLFTLKALFLPHHVFNEVYIGKRDLFRGKETEVNGLILSAVVFNGAIYCCILKLNLWSYWLSGQDLTLPLLIGSGIWFALSIYGIRKILSRQLFFSACLLELLGCASVLIGTVYNINIFHVVLYHITFWALYPLTKMWNPERLRPTFSYLSLNAGLFVAIALISPGTPLAWHMTRSMLGLQLTFWSMFHILISYALSTAQPEWISRIFQPPRQLLPAASLAAEFFPTREKTGSLT